jgi:hypothetical protein
MPRPVGEEMDQPFTRSSGMRQAAIQSAQIACTTSRLLRGWRAPIA